PQRYYLLGFFANQFLLTIDGMNHVLKNCGSTNPQEQMKVYADPSLPLADGLVDALCGFIRKLSL
ncbi:MAG: hypothetical protein Q4D36_11665, partial [Bacteroidales bacterium]|nr:hypothetical protein [Bacteroidales bacterium]